MRLFVTGFPRAGKTTLAKRLAEHYDAPLISTDDFRGMGWSEASAHVARLIPQHKNVIVEGVAVPRALRKYLAEHRDSPGDSLIMLEQPFSELSGPQMAMGKGVASVLDEIRPELFRRGMILV